MNVLSKLRVPFVSLALVTAGSAGGVGECPKGLVPVTEFRLFFGLADAAGKLVTDDEWQRFLPTLSRRASGRGSRCLKAGDSGLSRRGTFKVNP